MTHLRLRLVVRRHHLPEVRIVFTVQLEADPTIAQLLELVSETIPLESGEWGLEDYVVELRGRNGGSFECLHFQTVSSILEKDDEVHIRPLLSDDIRRRRLSGRIQITSDGRHLIDGVPFGRPRLKAPRRRPAIQISPRKRRRVNSTEQPMLLLTENGEEDHTADRHDEGNHGSTDEDDTDYASSDARDDGLQSEDDGEMDSEEELDKDDDSSSATEEESDSEDAETEALGKEVRGTVRGDSKYSVTTNSSEDEQESSSSNEEDQTSSSNNEYDSSSSDDEGDSSSSDNEDRSSSWNDVSAYNKPRKTPRPKTTCIPNELDSASDTAEEEEADATTKDEGAGLTEQLDKDSKADNSPDLAVKLSALQDAFPTAPRDVIEAQLLHHAVNSKKTYNKLLKTFPANKPFKQVRAFRKSLLKPSIEPEPAPSAPGTGLSRTQKRNARRREAKKRKDSKPSEDVMMRKQALLDTLANHSNNEAMQGKEANKPVEASHSSSDAIQNDTADAMDEGEASKTIKANHSSSDAVASDTPTRRSRLDIGAGRRMIFGAMGLRTPRTPAQADTLRAKLMTGVKSHDGTKLNQPHDVLRAQDSGSGLGAVTSQESEALEASWRDQIAYRAVECCEDGTPVTLSEPPFPFVQRWDPQQGSSKQGGKRKLRNQAHFYEDKVEYPAKKRQRQEDSEMGSPRHVFDTSMYDDAEDVDEEPLGQTHGLLGMSFDSRITDDDDLPSLPAALSDLQPLEDGAAARGMVITYKEFTVSAATGWQPGYVDITALVIEPAVAAGDMRLLLAKRDRRQKTYDEDGNRIYERFEAPDDEDGEDDGYRLMRFADLSQPKIVQGPIQAAASQAVQDALALASVAFSESGSQPGSVNDGPAHFGTQATPEAPIDSPFKISSNDAAHVASQSNHSRQHSDMNALPSLDSGDRQPIGDSGNRQPDLDLGLDGRQRHAEDLEEMASKDSIEVAPLFDSEQEASGLTRRVTRASKAQDDSAAHSPSSANSLPSLSDIYLTASTSRQALTQSPSKPADSAMSSRKRTTLSARDVKYKDEMRQFLDEEESIAEAQIKAESGSRAETLSDISRPTLHQQQGADPLVDGQKTKTLARTRSQSKGQSMSQPPARSLKESQVNSLRTSSPQAAAPPKRRGRPPKRAAQSHDPVDADASDAHMDVKENYAGDSIDEYHQNEGNEGGSSLPTGLGWVEKMRLRRSPRRAGSLPVSPQRNRLAS